MKNRLSEKMTKSISSQRFKRKRKNVKNGVTQNSYLQKLVLKTSKIRVERQKITLVLCLYQHAYIQAVCHMTTICKHQNQQANVPNSMCKNNLYL